MADEPVTPAPPAPDSGLEQRVGSLETKLDLILDRLKGGESAARSDAQGVTEARLSASSTVADEVQAELDRRDAAAKAAERDQLLGTHSETLAKLTEQKPQAPVRKVETIMGWR
jgi:hypothetical protein